MAMAVHLEIPECTQFLRRLPHRATVDQFRTLPRIFCKAVKNRDVIDLKRKLVARKHFVLDSRQEDVVLTPDSIQVGGRRGAV